MNDVIDFITGRPKPDVGAEGNRQLVERLLVEEKGYARQDVEVDRVIQFEMQDETYTSAVDLVVNVKGAPYMVIKCAPGSLESRQREIIAAARLLLEDRQVPIAVASSGEDAIVWDAVSGRKLGQGLAAIPDKARAETIFDPGEAQPLPAQRRRQVELVFRSYDSMNINRTQNL
jgi:hypothetical protein